MSAPERINYIRHLTAFFAQVQKDDCLHANHISLYMALFQLWNQQHFPTTFPVLREEVLSLCRIGSRSTYSRCLKDLERFNYIIYKAAKHPFAPSMVSIRTDVFDKQLPSAEDADVLKNEPMTGPKMSRYHAQKWAGNVPKNGPVSDTKMGHIYYKHINSNKREGEIKLAPSKKSNKNEFTNSRHGTDAPGAENEDALTLIPPDLRQVKEFFHVQNYSEQEASKFFHHYQANGWRQGGKALITDWRAAAHKWMLNINQLKFNSNDYYTKPSNGAGPLHINENKSYTDPL
ncbi:hypothetical protein [Chitinophaga sp. OAE865]|uniref:hypothetical protein n=1 Tax=Chitinophaga sp. OAE865 TaxID=2817898 RepID=UPI001AE4D873